jgi:hypothetical protein
MEDQSPRSVALLAENQAALVRFLSTDIDVGFTFLEVAKTTSSPDHVRSLIEKARVAIATVRHLAERIEDPNEWRGIHDSVNQLEAAVNAFSN